MKGWGRLRVRGRRCGTVGFGWWSREHSGSWRREHWVSRCACARAVATLVDEANATLQQSSRPGLKGARRGLAGNATRRAAMKLARYAAAQRRAKHAELMKVAGRELITSLETG